jgi:hypothetical protein
MLTIYSYGEMSKGWLENFNIYGGERRLDGK